MIGSNVCGAGGDNDRHGYGHHSGGGINFNEGNDQDPGSHHQNPRGPGSKNDSDGGEAPDKDGGTPTEMDAAEFLSLFAPPENRDIANGLELLDMVDEADQYEIVRSFAAKYIVPFATGHES